MKYIISLLVFIFLCSALLPIASNAESSPHRETVRGQIVEMKEDTPGLQRMEIRIEQGEFRGETVTVEHSLSGNQAQDFYFNESDRVLVWIESENGTISRALVRELARDHYLTYLGIFFALSIILIGGLKGIKTVISLAFTIFLIMQVLIPLILGGLPPVFVTIVIASIITVVSVLLISGFNRKSAAAILGTIGGVILAGVLATVMTRLTRLTGFSGEEAQMLMYVPNANFDFQGLLLAGMIIGAIGAVLDVGVSIASAVDELKRSNPAITARQLIKSGMNLGRDIMGTMANTLILAYTGASMSLLLVLNAHNVSFNRVINMEAMATELIRIMAGSIGLIYAIPLTAVIAGFLYKNADSEKLQKEADKPSLWKRLTRKTS
ncbi:YibE/F family protein [Salipaludibacillus sp. CUR1]|uniref:YibE/F family protein n=1 Tax=Salipaludibacillus sp. CUR1 TaxID=2820003 RepID=UPI001E2FE64B|nr:YibE/F family protein [Salipaludibacillus sp. CUR1]MCE7793256.1 YibE/F family protein [Salipaludibacillus sp. CUR1]